MADRTAKSARFAKTPYRGVERRYFHLGELDASLDLVDVLRPHPLWERYDQADDSDALRSDRALALDLRAAMERAGLDLDVIYVEVPDVPLYEAIPNETRDGWSDWWQGVLPYRRDIHERFPQPPTGMVRMGVDLSYPFPSFNSLIANPGPEIPQLTRDVLNENGLIERNAEAINLMNDIYRGGYTGTWFVALEVWAL